MGAPRFFVGEPLSSHAVDAEVDLPEAVAHHALRVLRLAAGHAITLFDGSGGEYAATITRTGKRDAGARIGRFDAADRESPLVVTLAQAVTASDTMDAIVRHAVELAAATIQPVISERGARFPGGAHGAKRLAHWRQVAIAACEQCGRNRVPVVAEPIALSQWLSTPRAGLVLDAQAEATLGSLPASNALDVLVGPEGGLTGDEVARAAAAGLRAVRLGPRILRAETAALTALATVNLLWGDLNR